VTAHIDAQRGLAEGELLGASVPGRVRPGQLVTVRLRILLFRGGVRTVRLRLRIPRRAHGRYTATLRGPEPATLSGPPSPGGLSGSLVDVFSPGVSAGGPPPAPPSLSALRRDVAGIAGYDGLTLSSPGHASRRVYRDPALVIAGQTMVAFAVR
jgi:hypothetical protein